MRLNILIGGKAGQGINKVSEIVSSILVKQGYFTFNYREYPSLIRGGHNFNILSVSDNRIGSIESKIDLIIAMDEKTSEIHKNELKKDGLIVGFENFKDLGRNLNIALAGALIKILGIEKNILLDEIKKEFKNNEDTVKAAEKGYESGVKIFDAEISNKGSEEISVSENSINKIKKFSDFKKLKNKIFIMNGSIGVSEGAINSKINLYLSYPMTPATGVLHYLAGKQIESEKKLMVFQPENEIAVANQALGASFAGAKVMIGTSGGGYDLITEALSMQGMSEIPLVVYLASRPGPGTGIPTYSMQNDLDAALRGGHGEFPRVVIAPGDPIECVEKTNEACYLAEKFNTLSIILSDKHLAESEFSSDRKPNKILNVNVNRKVPGEAIVKASSYEHDEYGNTSEDSEIAKKFAEVRLKKYENIKKECQKFQMIKIYGNPSAKNMIIGWGSTKTAILDALDAIDNSINTGKGKWKFLQVLYMKPFSDLVKNEIEKVEKSGGKIILIEQNVTGQLGRLIREKTGIKINNRILSYDTKPFYSDKLMGEILGVK